MGNTAVKKIGKREFIVKSYYAGGKSIDEILTRLAVSKAYEEIENEVIYNIEKNLPKTLAKRGII